MIPSNRRSRRTLRTLSRHLFFSACLILITVTCTACGEREVYPVQDFLIELSVQSGISVSKDPDECFPALREWKILTQEEESSLDDPLDHETMAFYLGRLLDGRGDEFIDRLEHSSEKGTVSKKEALKRLEEAVRILNERPFKTVFSGRETEGIARFDRKEEVKGQPGDIVYLAEEDTYRKIEDVSEEGAVLGDASFEEIFEEAAVSGSFEADFSSAVIIPAYEESTPSHYVNNRYHLLAAAAKKTSFKVNGIDVEISASGSGLSVELTKETKRGTLYGQYTLTGVRPKYQYEKKDGTFNAFFTVDFETSEKAGLRNEKEAEFQFDPSAADRSSLLSLIRSVLPSKGDSPSLSVPVCTIRVPIPEIPAVQLVMELTLSLSAEGKAELVLANTHKSGFEIKDGHFRLIRDTSRDFDGFLHGGASAISELTFGIEAVKTRLMDVGIKAGIEASAEVTLHLYDSEGNLESSEVDAPYDLLTSLIRHTPDAKCCADLSANYLLSLSFNSSSSMLSKLGFHKSFDILDENDPVFGKLSHIEDGHFVPSCTRTSKKKTEKEKETFSSEKLLLEESAVILKKGETCDIEVKQIPEAYSREDLVYESEDSFVAKSEGSRVTGMHKGNTRILVRTKDRAYSVYLKVLVSG